MNPTSSTPPADLARLTRALSRQVAALTAGVAVLAVVWRAFMVFQG